jgi:hypothetical protein
MTKKEFERYLTKLRQYRPEFHDFLKMSRTNLASRGIENADTSTKEKQTQLFELRVKNKHTLDAEQFLDRVAYELHGSSTSQVLEPYPHRNGGLVYHRPSSFQTSLLYSHIPSRITSKRQNGFVVSSAGINASVAHKDAEGAEHLDWERKNTTLGIVPMRLNVAQLYRPPEVVATSQSASLKPSTSAPAAHTLSRRNPDLTSPPFTYPEGIKVMGLRAEGVTVRDQEPRTNPFRPGSINYSAHEDSRLRLRSSGPQFKPRLTQLRVPVGLNADLASSRVEASQQRERRKQANNIESVLEGILDRV